MERIYYSGDQLLTGGDIAHALVEYAAALAHRNASDSVEIPVRQEDGSIGRAQLLIGPASQLASETETSRFPEVTDDELVARLRAATARLGIGHVTPDRDADLEANDFELTRMMDDEGQ